jgi:hypothetical protein
MPTFWQQSQHYGRNFSTSWEFRQLVADFNAVNHRYIKCHAIENDYDYPKNELHSLILKTCEKRFVAPLFMIRSHLAEPIPRPIYVTPTATTVAAGVQTLESAPTTATTTPIAPTIPKALTTDAGSNT